MAELRERVVDDAAEDLTLTSAITDDKDVWIQRARAVQKLAQSDGWTDLGTKKGVEIARRTTEGNRMVMIRGISEIPEALETTDAMYVKGTGKTVHRFDDMHLIDYARFALPWPLANRDFVWMSGADWLENGVACIWAFSVEHTDCPRVKGVVRAEIISTGYVIEQTGNPGRCRVSYLVQSDPKSFLPNFIINAVASDQALNVMRLREYFDANPDGNIRPPLGVGGVEKKKKQRRKKKKEGNVEEEKELEGDDNEDLEAAFAESATISEKKMKKKRKKRKKKRRGGGDGGGWTSVSKGGKHK